MSQLSTEQEDLQASIKKSATIWGVILGLVVGGLVYWILSSQGGAIRAGGAIVGGLVVAYAAYAKSFKSGSKSARCTKCDAAFSITKSGTNETLASSNPMEKREEQDDGTTNVTTWTEEKYDVVDSYTCASCDDVTTKEYQVTRKKDEATEVIAAKVEGEKPAKTETPDAPTGKAAGPSGAGDDVATQAPAKPRKQGKNTDK